jgi:hypothetical protein
LTIGNCAGGARVALRSDETIEERNRSPQNYSTWLYGEYTIRHMTPHIMASLQQLPDQFFSGESFLTLAGASGMVFIVCNALQASLNFNPRWLALAVAEVIAIFGTAISHSTVVPSDYFVSLLNGCLIYCTAVGGTALAGAGQRKGKPRGFASSDSDRRQLFTPWF